MINRMLLRKDYKHSKILEKIFRVSVKEKNILQNVVLFEFSTKLLEN